MGNKHIMKFGPCIINWQFQARPKKYFDDSCYNDLTCYLNQVQTLGLDNPRYEDVLRDIDELAANDAVVSDKILQSSWFGFVRRYLEVTGLFAQTTHYKHVFRVCFDDVKNMILRPTYIYFLIGEEGDLLYIGQAGDIYQRLVQHKSTGVIPFVKVLYIEYPFGMFSLEDINAIERDLIILFDPPHNTNHSPRVVGDKLHNWSINLNFSGDSRVVDTNRLVLDSMVHWLDCTREKLYEQVFLLGLQALLSNPYYMRYKWKWQRLPKDPLGKLEPYKYGSEFSYEI